MFGLSPVFRHTRCRRALRSVPDRTARRTVSGQRADGKLSGRWARALRDLLYLGDFLSFSFFFFGIFVLFFLFFGSASIPATPTPAEDAAAAPSVTVRTGVSPPRSCGSRTDSLRTRGACHDRESGLKVDE